MSSYPDVERFGTPYDEGPSPFVLASVVPLVVGASSLALSIGLVIATLVIGRPVLVLGLVGLVLTPLGTVGALLWDHLAQQRGRHDPDFVGMPRYSLWLRGIAIGSIALAVVHGVGVAAALTTREHPVGMPSASPTRTPEPAAPPSTPAPTSSSTPAQSTTAPFDADQLLAVLDGLPATTAPAGDYVRAAFGPGWGDPDRNGCDARNDVLGRDLMDVVHRAGTNDCVVSTGTLHDPYTGVTIHFVRGNETSELVQIDHVVPLAWAWANGASTWTPADREAFASDARNLLAVDGATNQAKSASGPSDWMPPNTTYACDYARHWVTVLSSFPLTVPADDRAELRRILVGCD